MCVCGNLSFTNGWNLKAKKYKEINLKIDLKK